MVRIIENYTLYEVIGEGAYGKVYRAVNKLDNKQYAVKVIQVKKFQANKKLQECTIHQINILTNIQKNCHIIIYYEMHKTQNNFYFVYQYCNGGTLQEMLRKQNTIDQKTALLIFQQLIQAFQVLNKCNVMHRDLKPDNIFFHNGVVKVGDFGFCKSLEKAQMTKTMLGSPIYMAPQILNGQIYSNKADIWSIGVVLYEMLYGVCPFESSSIPKLIQVLKDTQLQFPSQNKITQQTKRLLKRILTKDPQKRIQWLQLFQIKISNDGRLEQKINGKILGFDEDKRLIKDARQIIDQNDSNFNNNNCSPPSPGIKQYVPSIGSGYHHFITPRKNNQIPFFQAESGRSSQTNQQKIKTGLMKKPQGTVYQGQTTLTVNSPLRKIKANDVNPLVKQKVIKFHQELVRGINIVRSMGLNNEKYTPLFSYFILKSISQKLKKFKQQQLQQYQDNNNQNQYRQVFDIQIQQLQNQIYLIKNKVQEFIDWKKAVKSKILQIKNTRLCYQMVMFLVGENYSENVSINQMKYLIKTKIN